MQHRVLWQVPHCSGNLLWLFLSSRALLPSQNVYEGDVYGYLHFSLLNLIKEALNPCQRNPELLNRGSCKQPMTVWVSVHVVPCLAGVSAGWAAQTSGEGSREPFIGEYLSAGFSL